MINTIRAFIIVLAATATAALTAPAAVGATPLTTELVADGFTQPLALVAAPHDHHRLFVVEKAGLIHIIKDGVVLPTPFLDLRGVVSPGGHETGLLGLAFHPDYWSNGYFYVNFTRAGDDVTFVKRYSVMPSDPDRADPATGHVVFGPIAQPYPNHNGGCIAFGPDGKLYIGMGDGGSSGDPECRAQDPTTALGKMIRLNDDGTVPADNPFVNDPAVLDEIWSIGFRNPWRFSFDRKTGDLYIGDVGQSNREEIDFQPASSTGGENYGWKVMEGSLSHSSQNCGPNTPPPFHPDLLLPILEYDHSQGRCSVTGGYVYRGCAIPDLRGSYFYGDYCSAEIESIRYNGSRITEHVRRTAELDPTGGLIDLISSFGQDSEGELYIVDFGFLPGTGKIYRIIPDLPAPFEDLGFATPGTGGLEPELDVCGSTASGGQAVLRLRDAAPLRPALLVLSLATNPAPVPGGTLVPGLPPWRASFHDTDENGRFLRRFNGGGGPVDVYAQFIVDDPAAVSSHAFSNAVKIMIQP